MDLFLKALVNKWRFQTTKGALTAEDLFDLSLASLDNLAKAENKTLKASEEESFIPNARSGVNENRDRLDLLKAVIAIKVAEAEKKKKAADTAAKRQQLRELISAKQDDALKAKSMEDLLAELAALENS